MSDPFITVTTSRIKDGRVEECMRVNREIAHLVEEHEPRMIAFHVFLNEAEDEVVGVQVHPDADSMEIHLEIMRQKIARAMDFLELVDFKVLGAPGPVTSGLMATLHGAGTHVDHKPVHVAGFTRTLVE